MDTAAPRAILRVAGLIVYCVTIAGAARIFLGLVATEIARSLHQSVALRACTRGDPRY